jgi:hypothetical protein
MNHGNLVMVVICAGIAFLGLAIFVGYQLVKIYREGRARKAALTGTVTELPLQRQHQ